MPASPSITSDRTGEFASGALERQLDEWAAHIRADVEPAEFFRHWLRLAVHTARADAAAVWLLGSEKKWSRLSLDLNQTEGQPLADTYETAPPAILEAIATEGTCWLRQQEQGRPVVRGLTRIRQGGQAVGICEGLWPEGLFQSAQGWLKPFLGASSELAGDFLVQHELGHLRREHGRWRQWQQLLTAAQAQSGTIALAQQLVNDGRPLTGSDRISLLMPRGLRWTLKAVSGVDTIDPRSSTVLGLERYAAEVVREPSASQPVSDSDSDLTAESRLQLITSAQAVIAVPLSTASGESAGLLVCERFEPVADRAAWEQPCRQLGLIATAPWRAAVEAERGWAGRWRQSLQQQRGRRLLIIATLVATGLAVAAFTFIPAPLVITTEGTLLPRLRRDVFAGTTGRVARVLVNHGAVVQKGMLLAELRDSAAELESTRIDGEIATLRARVAVVQAARVSALVTERDGAQQAQQLAGEEIELKERLDSLLVQQKLLTEERQQTQVVSPLSGEVLTWDVSSRLTGRPVERGQVLMTVGDVAGPWVIEAAVRERDVGELWRAMQLHPEGLPVIFTPVATTQAVYRGKLVQMAGVSELNERGDPSVRMTIQVEPTEGAPFRPGVTVLPRIDCGTRPLGVVWFRELFQAARRQWWLWR